MVARTVDSVIREIEADLERLRQQNEALNDQTPKAASDDSTISSEILQAIREKLEDAKELIEKVKERAPKEEAEKLNAAAGKALGAASEAVSLVSQPRPEPVSQIEEVHVESFHQAMVKCIEILQEATRAFQAEVNAELKDHPKAAQSFDSVLDALEKIEAEAKIIIENAEQKVLPASKCVQRARTENHVEPASAAEKEQSHQRPSMGASVGR